MWQLRLSDLTDREKTIVGVIITTIVILRRRHWARYGARSGEARLAERYANGEIDEQEYREKLAVLKEQGR